MNFDQEVAGINAYPKRPPTGASMICPPSTAGSVRSTDSGYSVYAMKPPSERGDSVPETNFGRATRLDLQRDRYFARQNMIRQKQMIDQLEVLVKQQKEKEEEIRFGTWAKNLPSRQGETNYERLVKQPPVDPRKWRSRKYGYGTRVVIPNLRGADKRSGWGFQGAWHERRRQQALPGSFHRLGFGRVKELKHEKRFRHRPFMRNRHQPWNGGVFPHKVNPRHTQPVCY